MVEPPRTLVFAGEPQFPVATVGFGLVTYVGDGATPDASQSPAALAAEFAQLRAESLRALAEVTTADLARTARHSELGLVTMGEMLHEWAGHDLMHTVQAERALMQPFIRGCGPWQAYFKDHIVA